MYILKIKSIGGNSNYVQIRDNNFTLLAYCSFENLHKTLIKIGKSKWSEKIIDITTKAEYWKMKKIDLDG